MWLFFVDEKTSKSESVKYHSFVVRIKIFEYRLT